MKKDHCILCLCLATLSICFPQHSGSYKYFARTLVFYNLENFFDIKNDSLIFDDQRTPEGDYGWSQKRFSKKVAHLSRVINEIRPYGQRLPPTLIGLCEIENASVLDSLRYSPLIFPHDYGVVHYDSPDERGIDVALLYQKSKFQLLNSKSVPLKIYDPEGKRDYTRDQLVVSGIMDGEILHVIINHWPSRSGGQTRSAPYRKAAAELCLKLSDSLARIYPSPKIILMGDFNDNPTDQSLYILERNHLSSDSTNTRVLRFKNLMAALFKKGVGTLAYRDEWSLFDQILLSQAWLEKNTNTWTPWKVGVFNPEYLQVSKGRYKGYPKRTYVGTTYQGGYSDHFPVYLVVIKKVD